MTNEKQHLLSDPASPVFGIISTVIMGALPLIDASKLNVQQRRAVHGATAVMSGLYIGVTVGGKRLPLRVLAGLATAAATLRFADAGDVMDARLEEKLRRAGTRHPRRWMAAGAAAFTFAGFLGDRAAARRGPFMAVPGDEPEQARSLDPRVRGLIEGILDASDIAGARELREQLGAAQEVYWADEFISTVYFKVPADLPRAVPHDQVFPVRAQFVGPEGAPYQVLLQISAGQLDQLAAETSDQETAESVDNFLKEWPDPSEAVYVLDNADGTKIVSQPAPPSQNATTTGKTG
ncbi:hypothetical protein [Arthrobacter sp. H20]|uniref:hypothetical protein n=1 Tax=Arthrobacter sp. H20 TaxID=1267981 RepID=UPI00047B8FE0|nr:hypothetical protein [Arthrobacter sp. H20]